MTTLGNTAILDNLTINSEFSSKKKIFSINAALNLSTSINTAVSYSGSIIMLDASSGAFAITLPTATTAVEAAQLLGWHATFVILTPDSGNSNDITIVRGDTGNDEINKWGIHVVDGATGDGLTISSNVITFDASGGDVSGDHVDIVCYSASASATKYGAKAFITS